MDVLLSELTATLFGSLDYASSLRDMARALCVRAAAGCAVDLDYDTPSLRIVHAPSMHDRPLDFALDALAREVVATDGSVATSLRHPLACRYAEELGMVWLLSVPLRIVDVTFGALTLFGEAPYHPPFDVDAAEELGRRVSSAIAKGQRYESAIEGARVRERILSTVSRELRSPLGVIMRRSEQILGGMAQVDPPLAGRRRVEAMRRSAQRMGKLVADLLDVSALADGAMRMSPARCDLRRVVEEAIDEVAPGAARAGVTIEDLVAPALPPTWADPSRICQVLSNLLDHALKYTSRGGTIRLAATVIGDAIAVSVEDTGCGMPSRDVHRMFDRFWQAQTTAPLGSGLGLALCRSIVELSGGLLTAESTDGQGTTVAFTLPRLALPSIRDVVSLEHVLRRRGLLPPS